MSDGSRRQARAARTRFASGRGGILLLIGLALLLMLGGVTPLVLGVVRFQDAARLDAASVCAAGQQTGCRLYEPLTVADLNVEYPGRGEPLRLVTVQAPDGGKLFVYASDHDFGLWDRLAVSQTVQAELWNGNVIRLDDGAGHYIIADDSPTVSSPVLLIVGTGTILVGGCLLFLGVRTLRRNRSFQYARQ